MPGTRAESIPPPTGTVRAEGFTTHGTATTDGSRKSPSFA